MKYLILVAFLTFATMLHAQKLKPQSIYASYFGETITHPGLKIGVNYDLKNWKKSKTKKSGSEKIIHKRLDLSPSVGFFYHKHYQTGLFLLPEISLIRKNGKGNFLSFGLGAGYMRTFVPSVYDLNSDGEIVEIHTGYNYFITNYAIAFGKDLSVKKNVPISIYLKPQWMYAVPNFSNGVSYVALEIGLVYKLSSGLKH